MKGIKIGNKESKYPIIQGGMGVGVSLHKLAGAVSKEGGIGVISTADIGYQEDDFSTNPMQANLRAIGKEIKKAREIAGEDKIIGVNIMVALKNYADIVKECVKNKIDLIISGAGIPKELPEYVQGTETKIAPIVSSLRCCQLIVKHWIKKYNYVPDMIVIEGPKAGGHLGFKSEELLDGNQPKLEDIAVDVVDYIKEVSKETGKEKCKITKCYGCIKTCNVANTPYCITKALINAVKGNMNDALIFCGSNVDKVKEIVSVKSLMQELVCELV